MPVKVNLTAATLPPNSLDYKAKINAFELVSLDEELKFTQDEIGDLIEYIANFKPSKDKSVDNTAEIKKFAEEKNLKDLIAKFETQNSEKSFELYRCALLNQLKLFAVQALLPDTIDDREGKFERCRKAYNGVLKNVIENATDIKNISGKRDLYQSVQEKLSSGCSDLEKQNYIIARSSDPVVLGIFSLFHLSEIKDSTESSEIKNSTGSVLVSPYFKEKATIVKAVEIAKTEAQKQQNELDNKCGNKNLSSMIVEFFGDDKIDQYGFGERPVNVALSNIFIESNHTTPESKNSLDNKPSFSGRVISEKKLEDIKYRLNDIADDIFGEKRKDKATLNYNITLRRDNDGEIKLIRRTDKYQLLSITESNTQSNVVIGSECDEDYILGLIAATESDLKILKTKKIFDIINDFASKTKKRAFLCGGEILTIDDDEGLTFDDSMSDITCDEMEADPEETDKYRNFSILRLGRVLNTYNITPEGCLCCYEGETDEEFKNLSLKDMEDLIGFLKKAQREELDESVYYKIKFNSDAAKGITRSKIPFLQTLEDSSICLMGLWYILSNLEEDSKRAEAMVNFAEERKGSERSEIGGANFREMVGNARDYVIKNRLYEELNRYFKEKGMLDLKEDVERIELKYINKGKPSTSVGNPKGSRVLDMYNKLVYDIAINGY